MWTLDFESEAIAGNTSYRPPRPVGVAIKADNYASVYETDWEMMRKCVATIFDGDEPILCHHSKFDVAVACHWFDLPMPDPLRVFDTMFDLYLDDDIMLSTKTGDPLAHWRQGLQFLDRDISLRNGQSFEMTIGHTDNRFIFHLEPEQ